MITLQVRGLDETIQHLENGAGRFANDVMFAAIQELTLRARRELQRGMSGATVDRGFWGRGSPPGPIIGVRSGELRRSISPGVVYRAGPVVTGAVGTNAKQMAALETGETISPTSGRYLRIPTKYAQTPAGVDRNAGRSMRDVPNTSVHRSRAGNLFIWGKTKGILGAIGSVSQGTTRGVALGARRRGDAEVPLYLLATEVKMPAKHTFRDTALIMAPLAKSIAGGRAEVWVSKLAAA